MTDLTHAADTPAAESVLASTWTIVHVPNGMDFEDAEATTMDFDEPVDEEQAWADAEHSYGDDFGTVCQVVAGDDPEGALAAYLATRAAEEADLEP